jgi:hypothetical protein
MFEDSGSDLDSFVLGIVHSAKHGLRPDVTTAERLAIEFNLDRKREVTTKAVGHSLKRAGARKLNKVRVGSDTARPWALVNFDQWKNQDAETIRVIITEKLRRLEESWAPPPASDPAQESTPSRRSFLDDAAETLIAEATATQTEYYERRLSEGAEADGPGGPPLDHTNLTTGLWSYDKADPERKSSLLAWEDALERAGARYLYDKRGRKRTVSLNVFEIAADGVLQRRKLTYFPIALLNADHWKKCSNSTLTMALTISLVACGTLEYSGPSKILTFARAKEDARRPSDEAA